MRIFDCRHTVISLIVLLCLSLLVLNATGFAEQVFESVPDLSVVDANQADTQTAITLADIVPQLISKRAVLVGESHDRYDHHLNQLAVIQALHAQQPGRWVIGLEFFQRPFQPYLDAYIAGTLDEEAFLLNSEYFERWRYDYRLYRPLFHYAQANGIKLVALNAARELTRRVSAVGLDGLDATERARLPQQIDQSDQAYRARLKQVFDQHPGGDFERFWQVQLVWDETMAETAADYLIQHPEKAMILLAGRGHIEYGAGIPKRLQRRLLPEQTHAISILLPGETGANKAKFSTDDFSGADFLLLSASTALPPAGKMGVMLGVVNDPSGVSAEQVVTGSAAEQAGLKPADRIISIAGRAVHSLGDVRLALLDRAPGEQITVRVQQ